jgi:uncharacterized OsmC-like protein
MDAKELRDKQAALKARYKEQPASATLTLHARGRVLQKDVALKIETGHGKVTAGLHPYTGGSGLDACSGDMMLESLAACAGVTLGAVATALGVTIRAGSVQVEGDLDFRGTLGMDKSVPVGFQAIRLRFELDSDATPEQLDTLLKLTERYCVIFQTLRQPPAVSATLAPAAATA